MDQKNPESQKSEKAIKINNSMIKTIELKNVSFFYKDKTNTQNKILKNINITINNRDRIGIVGPSGSGKSTLCDI